MDVETVYEDGTLKLPHTLPLQPGQKVTITIHPPAKRSRVILDWKGSQEDLDYLLGPDNHPRNRDEE
jgi:predicted DNA-binding antitoxin AbrB/MazE fold protein